MFDTKSKQQETVMKVKDFLKFVVWNTTVYVCALNGSFERHILDEDDYDRVISLFVPIGQLEANMIIDDRRI